MVTVEGALVSLLLNAGAVTALVGDRVHPSTDPQSIPRPKLTYQRISTDRGTETGGFTNGGATGHAVATIQIDCWSDSLFVAKQIAIVVRQAINGYSGTIGGIVIGSIQVTNDRELPGGQYEGQEKPVQRIMMEIKIQFSE